MVGRRAERLINTLDAKGKPLETNFTQEDIQEGLDLANGSIEVDGVVLPRIDVYNKIARELEVLIEPLFLYRIIFRSLFFAWLYAIPERVEQLLLRRIC